MKAGREKSRPTSNLGGTMKLVEIVLALALVAVSSNAFAAAGSPGLPLPSAVEFLLNDASPQAMRQAQLGTQLTKKKVQLLVGVYDSQTSGGSTVGAHNLKDVDGKDAVLPAGAVIKKVMLHAVSAVTSGGSATLSFGAASATDLKGATGKASFSLNALLDGVPDGTAANSIRLSSQTVLTATVGTAALTAGKVEAFVEWYPGQ